MTNHGPDAATDVESSDPLPDVDFLSASGEWDESDGVLTWGPSSSLTVGKHATFIVRMTAHRALELTNKAWVTSSTLDFLSGNTADAVSVECGRFFRWITCWEG